ncbi:MAG: hypothetical protein AAB617_02685 [Patescibacteria group bacterium]
MVKVINFHENLEHSLERLGQKIKIEKKEHQGLESRELIKQSLKTLSQQTPIQPIEEKTEEESVLPGYLTLNPTEPQIKFEIERLVDLVFHKGLAKALSEAKKYPPFIEDSFHDALIDKLLPELKKRGMI